MSIKKVLFGTFLSLALVAASISAPVFTKDACEVAEIDDPLICGTAHNNEEAELQNRVKNTPNTVYLWIGIIAVIVIIIGGIKYMTSAGNPEKSQRRQKRRYICCHWSRRYIDGFRNY